MNIHESAEDYLEAIYMLGLEKGSVRSIDIANSLGYSKPSVSVAMKQLEENGYIRRDADSDTAYRDACKIEHDLSDETFRCIQAHMAEHGMALDVDKAACKKVLSAKK